MRISANTDVCVGAGQCVLTGPGVFDQDDDGVVVLVTDQLDDEAAVARARIAVDLCPSRALSVVD
ncbi:ferredoxin [Pseudonocardia ailaonensis]|uniref:Ferredoxin n=1 Tax=Pseudonocardia ailaonensis TaxID=367279 RepID=A0ABN2MLE7_9PSEU